MPNELERAFAALADDAGRVRLEPAATLRRRADHRRAITLTATAAVLVAGTLIGSRMVLAGPPPGPAPATHVPSPAPSAPSATPPSTPPSTPPTTPTSTAPASSGRAIPSSIPARAFLRAADAPGKAQGTPRRLNPGAHELPSFCGKTYNQGDKLGVRATQNLYYTELDAPPESTPKAAIYEDVLVFKGAGATAFMTVLRAAVDGCRTEAGSTRNYLRGPIGAGDDSVLIEQTTPATDDAGEPAPGGGLHHRYWAVIRVGDSIAFVSNTGWESVPADRADTVQLGRRAEARLAAWRN